MIFQKGGNAVDAACAMIAATSTMWDTLSWGGETQALIYNPNTGKVIGINALFERKGFKYIAINAGYWILCLGLMGGVLCAFA